MGTDATVIIPCAGEPNESLLPLTGKTSTALVSLNGKPVIYWTINYLLGQGFKSFVVPVRKADSFICNFITQVFGAQAQFSFPVPDFNGELGYTLVCCLPHVHTPKALIVLGDTYFEFPKQTLAELDQSFVLVHPVEDASRWCLAHTDKSGVVERLVDKPEEYNRDPVALIGVYGIAQWADFAASLTEGWAQHLAQGDRRLPLTDVLDPYRKNAPLQAVTAERWFDCGHADKLLESRRRLLQIREFNSIQFDELRGTITKSSKDREKFLDEINYYLLLPERLRIFFPRVVAHRTSWEDLSLTLEYYGYRTLSELLLYENLDPKVWRLIFEHLADAERAFSEFRRDADLKALREMYLDRPESRLAQLRSSAIGELVNARRVTLNGNEIRGIPEIWPAVREELQQLVDQTAGLSVIHGDLCFSNILYDLSGRLCKFIDPRGSFGNRGIYGDPRYDVAKLYHSLDGAYDFIVNDLFRVDLSSNTYSLDAFSGPKATAITAIFEEVFFKTFDRSQIELIEGVLFLTMGVFHGDSREPQTAMFLTGLRILNDLLVTRGV